MSRYATKTTYRRSFLLIGVLFFLSACVSDSAPEVDAGDEELVQGRQIFVDQCSSCHGSAGEGRNGSQLNEGSVIAAYPEVEDQIKVISEGKNAMPSFSPDLSEEEIAAVVRYTRESLAE